MDKNNETRFKEIFYIIDVDKDDFINTNEVGLALRALGLYLSKEDIDHIIEEVDDNSGKVSYETLKEIYLKWLINNKGKNEFIDAFHFFDQNNKGYVDINEIKQGLMSLGEGMTEEEIDIVLEEAKAHKSGKINYIEFASLLFDYNIK